jgi:hypothetical protein
VSSLGQPRRNVISIGREVADAILLSGAEATPERIVLVFHAPRIAALQGGRVAGWQWQSPADALARRAPNALVLVRTDGKAKHPERVEIASQGDPLQLARVLVELPRGFVSAPLGHSAVPRSAPAPEPTAVFDHAEYQREMRRVLDGLPVSVLTRAREFFFELDRHTEADLVTTNPFATPTEAEGRRVLAAAHFVRRALVVRQTARMREHVATPFRSTPFADPLSFAPMVRTVSDVFLRLLWRHFPDGHGGLDLAAVEEAFELFATGELRLRLDELDVTTTEPSSGAYFLFGEFALLAPECGVEPALWTRLANVMVRSQRLFCRTYPAAVERPRLADYAVTNHAPDGRPAPSERAALRAEYAGLTHTELSLAAMQNLELHAPGELDLETGAATDVLSPAERPAETQRANPAPGSDGRPREVRARESRAPR